MNDTFKGYRGLRLLALITVIAGVLALAAAAFVFSYAGVHRIALAAGVPARLARFYPALLDAVLVVACAAALALRGARWWTRWLTWLSIIALVALVGAVDAVHAMGIKLPRRPVEASVAVLPWVLLLLGFRLWLSVLRQPRHGDVASVAPASAAAAGKPAEADAGSGAEPAMESETSAGGLDLILRPYPAESMEAGEEPTSGGLVRGEAGPVREEGAGHGETPTREETPADGETPTREAPEREETPADGETPTREAPERGVPTPILGAPVPEQEPAQAEPDQAASPDFHRVRSTPVRPGE